MSDADTMTSLLHEIDRLDGDEIRRCLQEYTADAEVELAKEVGR